jgi:hypothetical protein
MSNPIVTKVGIYMYVNVFTESFPNSGRLFLFIKNLLFSNGCSSVVYFAAVA